MYAGRIVESGLADDVFERPAASLHAGADPLHAAARRPSRSADRDRRLRRRACSRRPPAAPSARAARSPSPNARKIPPLAPVHAGASAACWRPSNPGLARLHPPSKPSYAEATDVSRTLHTTPLEPSPSPLLSRPQPQRRTMRPAAAAFGRSRARINALQRRLVRHLSAARRWVWSANPAPARRRPAGPSCAGSIFRRPHHLQGTRHHQCAAARSCASFAATCSWCSRIPMRA